LTWQNQFLIWNKACEFTPTFWAFVVSPNEVIHLPRLWFAISHNKLTDRHTYSELCLDLEDPNLHARALCFVLWMPWSWSHPHLLTWLAKSINFLFIIRTVLMSVIVCSDPFCISIVEGTGLSAQDGSSYTNYRHSFLWPSALSCVVRDNILGLCSCRIPYVWPPISLIFDVESVRPIPHPNFTIVWSNANVGSGWLPKSYFYRVHI
jgi:hypothetical protein